MIVATAGHIDHGKTSLVRALTGVDTDRLPEEKARGISIDLGFAHGALPDGTTVGFIDVPGHERFVRNMLAGVCGIDFALLVVAADDGVMPQTVEHAQILDLLGVARGVVAITKVDRVDAARVAAVRAEADALLADTSLGGIPSIAVSSTTGEGVPALRDAIAAGAAAVARAPDDGRRFRLAIDRVFTIGGSGTVVTGTVFAGSVSAGTRLVVAPRGTAVRVRGLRAYGREIDRARPGQRCALNLTGVAVADVARGDWLCEPEAQAPTRRVDASFRLLPGQGAAPSAAAQVHVHLGAGDEIARLAPLGATIAPGMRTLVQIVFDRPVAALHGDRFIVRDSAAQRTLGGGIVVDPFAPAARRRAPERVALLEALARADLAGALTAWVARTPDGLALDRFETAYGLRPEVAAALYAAQDLVVICDAPRIGLPRARREAIEAAILAQIADFHTREPQALGLPEKDLQRAAAPGMPPAAFHALLQALAHAQRIVLGSGVARAPSHDTTDNAADKLLWERVVPKLVEAGARAPTVVELAAEMNVDPRTLRDLFFRRRASGAIFRVGEDRFYLRETMAAFAATASKVAAAQPGGLFTAAHFRDAIGIGRTLAIEILDVLDAVAVTFRVQDARRMHRDPVPILGAAKPIAPVVSLSAGAGRPVNAAAPASNRGGSARNGASTARANAGRPPAQRPSSRRP